MGAGCNCLWDLGSAVIEFQPGREIFRRLLIVMVIDAGQESVPPSSTFFSSPSSTFRVFQFLVSLLVSDFLSVSSILVVPEIFGDVHLI